ncbi:RAMP superfamily CRISPR-associated protein [Thermoanaerobacter thermocopriae]|uniref:RAMP superfamily CRISPR-associated protein n=1 Tax=Thermoanaerobacter thermocopriae TaxID=29350 RepID=UPI0004901895|nr:RAMP superfamily CRISPR-associated protein [Thermoanaerobacter thermocopriae]
MIWFKLIFKQNQPIHIGSVEWGVINETEIFIPGWTMWGALTNQFLKTIGVREVESAKKLFERITNFYPAIQQKIENSLEDKSPVFQELFPQYKKGNFAFGKSFGNDKPEQNKEDNEKEKFISKDKFKFEFVDTIVSTAIEPVLRSAKDESLHEFEYILPKSKLDLEEKSIENNLNQLYWVGLIGFEDEAIKEINSLIKNSNNNENAEENVSKNDESEKKELSDLLKKIFSKIYIGGDTKYGFGEMELLDPIIEVTEEKLSEWNITGNGTASIKPNFPLRQFFKFSDEIKFEGELKLLSEFDFTQNIPRVQEAGYFINVGSKVSDFNGIDLSKYHLTKGKFEKIK